MSQNLIQSFIEKEKENNRKGKRLYLHFDNRLKFNKEIVSYVTKPHNIVRHSFYPFLRFLKRIKKYTREVRITTTFKDREICFASHIDSFIYSWYSIILSDKYENIIKNTDLNDSVLAYRKIEIDNHKGNNIYFAKQIFDFIKQQKESSVITLDIKKFFDSLNHQLLKKSWQQILSVNKLPEDHYKVFRSLTKFATVDIKDVFKLFGIKRYEREPYNLLKRICSTKEYRDSVRKIIKTNSFDYAIPQGSPLSALLSNIYLLEFDKFIIDLVKQKGGLYRRYCDDIIVVSDPKNADEIIDAISSKIKDFKLTINNDKTEFLTFIHNGQRLMIDKDKSNRNLLQYLGYEFDGEDITIRSSSLSRYYRKMKTGVRKTILSKIKNKQGNKIYKKSLYEKYSHLGKQNFLTYMKRAIDITKSEKIKQQMKGHWPKLQKEINRQEIQKSSQV